MEDFFFYWHELIGQLWRAEIFAKKYSKISSFHFNLNIYYLKPLLINLHV